MTLDELMPLLVALQDPEFEVEVINCYGESLKRIAITDDKSSVELYFEGDE